MDFISFFNVLKGLPPKSHGVLGLGTWLERLNHKRFFLNHKIYFFK